ncbi:ribonuclease H-like domain-containing protein [Tanacetum coccineum]
MALPEDHLAKFHKMNDAKEMWEAIKSRFGGNDESKKMQKYILKQQFEGFSVSNSEGLHKGYDRFQSLLSQLEIHEAGVDSLSFDDLYNNLRVFENDVKGSTASSSSTHNVAFVSENTSNINDVSTAYGVSNPYGHNSQYEQTSSYSLLTNQSSCPQLDHEDLEQLDEFNLKEMDLKWQVAMISMRMKKFYKKIGRKLQFDAKEPVGFDKIKVECYNCHKTWHFARECRTKGNQDNRRRDAWNSGNKDRRRSGKQDDSKALVTIDRECVDWTSHSEGEEDYALMACNSSGSDTEVTSCSNECKDSYAKLKKLYDAQREQLSDASIEIKAYTQDLDDKNDVLTYHKKLLAEAEKEKEDLKAKVEKWHNSSKNLGKLLNTQMSANDKFGLGYGDHRYDGILSYENEVLQSVFMNKESDLENQPLYDRFVTAEGMHAVPPPMTGNYMPSGPDIEIDYSQFTYGPKQSQTSESETQTSDFDTCESNISVETPEFVTKPIDNEPNVEQPSFASTNKQVKTPREAVKNQFTQSKNPKVDKKGLGYGFTTKACFVCGSLSHLIRDCDFHEKRMAKQTELNNKMKKKSSQREIRSIWNNVQRVNHRNQFFPKAVLTRTGKILINTARASSTNNVSTTRHKLNRQAVPSNGARKVNIVKPIANNAKVNTVKPMVSTFRKSLNRTTSLRTNFSYQKVNTAKVNAVSAVGVKRETAVKPSDYPQRALQKKRIVDSGCSRHMTRKKAYLDEYQDFNGGPVAFGGSKGYITGKACLIAKATIDKSNKWHRRMGHVNFKNLNKLVKGNLVRGLPSKIFQNDHTCVACQKGKQHKASCKAKSVSSISQPLQLLHMDLFGPTSIRSLNHKTYCLVITDDFSRFSWVFFLRTKDETSGILKDFIRQIENQLNQKVKAIRCDNGTEFKNKDFIEFCGSKGIKREYSNARTPQQNGVAERKNKTLIEAARTMLADSFLPNTFWAEAVISSENQANKQAGPKEANHIVGTKDIIDVGDSKKEDESGSGYHQKDEKPIKKQQNRTRDGKVCENEAKSNFEQQYYLHKLCKRKKKRSELQKDARAKERIWRFPICDVDDDNDYHCISHMFYHSGARKLSIMENELLDTIAATESDEFIKAISSPHLADRSDFLSLRSSPMDLLTSFLHRLKRTRDNVLNVLPTLELDFIPSSESIFAYVVWIFLPFLFIPVIPPYLLSCGDEDTIFDPGISKDCPDCEDLSVLSVIKSFTSSASFGNPIS